MPEGVKVLTLDAGDELDRNEFWTSVLNECDPMHDVDNSFVVDGSAFTNASEKNPTLSIVSLSWRATDYLAEAMRCGSS